jgi:hypothetical protein
MKEGFSRKEHYYTKEIRKKNTLIELYKEENQAKELRIEDLLKQVQRMKTQGGEKEKESKGVQTEEMEVVIPPLEISFEKPIHVTHTSNVKSTLLANMPSSEFSQSLELSNLEKSTARMEVISKQEQMLLNLNRQLNEDSNVFEGKGPLTQVPDSKVKMGETKTEIGGPSFDLGMSLKHFNQKLLNVIELNNQMMKVFVTRTSTRRTSSRQWRN